MKAFDKHVKTINEDGVVDSKRVVAKKAWNMALNHAMALTRSTLNRAEDGKIL